MEFNSLSAEKFQEFADSFVEGIGKHELQPYFMETRYELDEEGNAIMYDALVVKAQLAFFGIALRDHDFMGPAFADYADVVCAPPAQWTEGRSLRARACTYDTFEEFGKEEAPRYGKIENVFEMEAGVKYESMDSYLQAIKVAVHIS
ncbi:hypothetical protein CYMTET_8910 [Cymbomonas tetramitiformis]|uniref:Uncharacterized protein n=1 Tax=Cymbomonas tetramitiformis TaxID=36881 RepID=A0AAE0GS78_9CHLO|nr:hypothetical protein CYMTET_8910 [Cymbomonas tetramitiformis]